MALSRHTTKVAVLASLAVGVAVTLASGPFRARALEALKPELDAIQVQLANTVPKATYDKHTHSYTAPTVGGYARMDLILAHPDYLVPYVPPEKTGQGGERVTSRPK